jgi:Tol biopolymer transport system component
MEIHFASWFLVFALALSSCSIQVEQPSVVTPASTPESSSPTLSGEGSSQTNIVTTSQVPVTWGSLNLEGKLVYINGSVTNDVFSLQIQVLNLVTGEVMTIFDAPKYSWIYYVTVSPDNTQVLMTYSPPPADNEPPDQNIYIMPLDGSQPPKLLFTPPAKEDDYVEVEWSPDGKYIYFTHVNFQITPQPDQIYPLYEIYRMTFPDGKPERVAEKAFWPRVSSDSSHIAYISVDLFLRENKIYIADSNGKNPHEVVLKGQQIPEVKDAPIFTPDGQTLLFSAPVPAQAYQPNWMDKLMGVRVAKAHNVPSDWFSVPVTGGDITQLTNIQTTNLFASFAPDGKHIASHSTSGIFVMKPDGSELTMLIPNPQAVPGTVTWIP